MGKNKKKAQAKDATNNDSSNNGETGETIENTEVEEVVEAIQEVKIVEAAVPTVDDLDAMWSDDDDKPKKKGKNNKKNNNKNEDEVSPKNADDEDEPEAQSAKPLSKKEKEKLKKQKKKDEAKKQADKASNQTSSKSVDNNDDNDAASAIDAEIAVLQKKVKDGKIKAKEHMKLNLLLKNKAMAAGEAELKRQEEDDKRKIQEAKDQKLRDEENKLAKAAKKKELEKIRVADLKAKGLPTNKAEQAAFDKKKAVLLTQGIDIMDTLPGGKLYKAKGSRVNMKDFNKKKPVVKSDSTPPVTPTDKPEPKFEKVEEAESESDSDSNSESEEDWDADSDEEEKPKKSRKSKKSVSKSVSKTETAAPVSTPKTAEPIPTAKPDKLAVPDKDLINNSGSRQIVAKVKDDPSWAELDPVERVELRLAKRKKVAEKARDMNILRCPVLCVLGHVDTGKTKILDNLRKTNVQDGEAGGITQQIGATNVNIQTVRDRTHFVKELESIDIPGLLIIDTPGHESFANLRSRGQSLADMAILVVDIMHSLEPQTLESIELLKKGKTPFIIALNKIDRLYGWKPYPDMDIRECLALQDQNTKDQFDKLYNTVFADFATSSHLNVVKFWENTSPGMNYKEDYINIMPTSAHSGDGMGNLMAMVVQMSQTHLRKRVAFSEQVQCTVLEVKSVAGIGATIDVILTQGRLRYGDHIVIAGSDGPIHTQVKALIMPQADKDLRVTARAGGGTETVKEVAAANGVRVLGKASLENALAGTTMHVAVTGDMEEVDYFKDECESEIEDALQRIKTQKTGVYVMASTLGALEALCSFLKDSKIPFFGVNVGPVHKKDVMKASTMMETDPRWALILAFDVKVEREAQTYATEAGLKIFTADIIYHLFDAVVDHNKQYIKAKKDEFKDRVKFPAQLEIMTEHVIRTRDPIIVGVKIKAGQLKKGTTLIALNATHGHVVVGDVASIQSNQVEVDTAKEGDEVCIKVVGSQGEAPKLLGRHFEQTDVLVTRINRESINLLKEWWSEEMTKSDWKLVIKLKKVFNIM